MTTYAIGDLHGCLTPLQKLLDQINFDTSSDTLWLTGDLINRGPQSLDTLRFVRSLDRNLICVLGNHDLHLLAVIHGIRDPSSKDTLSAILNAPDIQELTDWLRQRPLMHHNQTLGYTLVHAGIHPMWSLPLAQGLANEVESKLRSDKYVKFLNRMYGNKPSSWASDLGKHHRRRFTINALTRMRCCSKTGDLDFTYSGPPAKAPKHLLPWYAVPNRTPIESKILFGHWSSHPSFAISNVIPLDRGCVWGGSLAAFALETEVINTVAMR